MKPLLRLLGLLAAVGVGLFLSRSAAREVTLVYDLAGAPGATGLEIDLRQGAELVRHAELRVPAAGPIRHLVRLPDGQYALRYRILTGSGSAVAGERPITVQEDATIVLPLGP